MKVVELRAALEARGDAASLSGNKAWLRRRLHTAVVQAYLYLLPGSGRGGSRGLASMHTLLTLTRLLTF